MKAVCFEGVQRVAVHELADPTIQQGSDAIVQVRLAGLCGSDLHPFFGREVGLDPGTVMGHEFVGEIVAVGDQVRELHVGDQVCAPFTTSCGQCFYCEREISSRCVDSQLFGWRENASGLHGGQASLVRVPLADGTLMRIPNGVSDEVALLLGDNLSTGYFAADMVGIQSGGVYAVVGCGTVGLLAIASALRLGANQVIAVDPNPSRLEIARGLGAIPFNDSEAASEEILGRTNGRGADGVMEMVGLPAAQSLAYELIRPGGVLAVIGCHCTPHFTFSPSDAYDKNLTYRTGRCPARSYMGKLSTQLEEQPMDLSWCITHRFDLSEAAKAYEVFAGQKQGCIKAAFQL
ncbi:MAG: alcohol dehydrogenase catalytic domain-containing protein [Rubripirellula sp.]